MSKLQATDKIVNFDKPNAYQAAVRAHAAKMEEWAAYVRAKSEELDHAAEAMTCPPGVKMNNLDHGDAEKIKEWSMQISAMLSQSRALSVKIREMEAKLRAQQEAQQEAQQAAQESDLLCRQCHRVPLQFPLRDDHQIPAFQPFPRIRRGLLHRQPARAKDRPKGRWNHAGRY